MMSDTIMNDAYIRKRLFELIDNSSISATKLSEELNLNKGYLGDVRRHRQSVPYDVLASICDFYHITLSEFFDPDYSLKEPYREINLLCQSIPEDQIQTVIIPILKKFAQTKQ